MLLWAKKLERNIKTCLSFLVCATNSCSLLFLGRLRKLFVLHIGFAKSICCRLAPSFATSSSLLDFQTRRCTACGCLWLWNTSLEVLLLVHLPALIFASGFLMYFHIFRRNFWKLRHYISFTYLMALWA